MLRALDEVRPATASHYFALFATVLRRELIRQHRAAFGPLGRHRLYASPDDDARRGVAPAGGSEPDRPMQLAEVHNTVAGLPDELRELVNLRFYVGLTEAEAAEVLGESRRTLSRRWAAAKATLADRLS